MIDARALIDPKARIGDGVSIGPFSVIGADVEIGDGTVIGPHAVIQGPTRIGRENRIHAFVSLGDGPQDKRFKGEPTRLEVGDRNTIREYCTMNRGTPQSIGVTKIGDDNFFMAYCHVAHDCTIGSNIIFANGTSLAGHVVIEDRVVFGGFTLVHQFCRIGSGAFTAMGSGIAKDVPPYLMVAGNPAEPHGLNLVGLKRRGFPDATLRALRQAYKTLYRSGLKLEEALAELKGMTAATPEIGALVYFIEASKRSIVR